MVKVVYWVGALSLIAGGMLWIVWGLAGPMLHDFITEMHYRRRGEKSPRTLRKEAIAELRAKVMSVEEAKEIARAYAKSQGREDNPTYTEPMDMNLLFHENEQRKPGDPLGSFYYSMYIGSTRPAPLLQIDAVDGTILQYKTFPR